MRSVHGKHFHPGLKDSQVCIGYAQSPTLEGIFWRTKVAGETRVRDGVLCTAIIVDHAEMIERGYEDCGECFIRE